MRSPPPFFWRLYESAFVLNVREDLRGRQSSSGRIHRRCLNCRFFAYYSPHTACNRVRGSRWDAREFIVVDHRVRVVCLFAVLRQTTFASPHLSRYILCPSFSRKLDCHLWQPLRLPIYRRMIIRSIVSIYSIVTWIQISLRIFFYKPFLNINL